MFCPKCGAQLKDGSVFCDSCGARLGSSSSESNVIVTQPESKDQSGEKIKFWQKSWVMWVCLLFLTPVGIILCYINRERHTHWKIICGVFAVIFFIGIMMPDDDNNADKTSTSVVQQEQTSNTAAKEVKQREYITVSATTLANELENNAAAAQKKYKNKYLKVTGKLGTIDSDGDYISIDDPTNDFSLSGVQCFIDKSDKNQSNFVLNLRKGQIVTAYGKITDVGELLGYHMDVDKFE